MTHLSEQKSHRLRLAQVWEKLVQLEQSLVGLEVVRARFHLENTHKSVVRGQARVRTVNDSAVLVLKRGNLLRVAIFSRGWLHGVGKTATHIDSDNVLVAFMESTHHLAAATVL